MGELEILKKKDVSLSENQTVEIDSFRAGLIGSFKKKAKRIVGRGVGSTAGNKCGRGQKGHNARSRRTHVRGFEGGQNPLVRRLPKVGFSNYPHRLCVAEVHVEDLSRVFDDGFCVTIPDLKKKKVIKGSFDVVKILLKGSSFSLQKKFTFASGFYFSKKATDLLSVKDYLPLSERSNLKKLIKKKGQGVKKESD